MHRTSPQNSLNLEQTFTLIVRLRLMIGLACALCFPANMTAQTPEFGENSANLQHRYLYWNEGLVLNYTGFGLVNGVTAKTTVGGVEVVDGISCRVVITDRSNDYLQHFWLAQDLDGNVWQLRNLDALTNQFHEEDVLYMPAYPKRFEDYELWDITYASVYTVSGTNVNETVPAGSFQNCALFTTVEDDILESEYFAPLVGLINSEARTTPRSGYRLASIENHTPPTEPTITRHPRSQSVLYAHPTVLAFQLVTTESPVYVWYEGESGDTSNSITNKNDGTFDTGLVIEEKKYWVRATISGQTFDSETAIISINNERVGPKLYGLGNNSRGQFGIGVVTNPPPTNLIRSGGVLSASAGTLHSLFITLDGTLRGMGGNDRSQLGQHPSIDWFSTPLVIDTDVILAEAGPEYNLYVKSDNSLWGFGQNDFGQLGVGDTDDRLEPVQIDTDVVAVSPSQHPDRSFSLYLKSDGTLMGMGNNQNGVLGVGPGFQKLTPVVIDTDVVQFSAANFHSHFIKSDGRLFSVGWNQFGQLGDGTFENRDLPVQIDTNVAQVSGGNNQSWYVKKNGDLYGMGSNIPGQSPMTETPVLYDTGVSYVDSGGWYKKGGQTVYQLSDKTVAMTGVLTYSMGGHILYLAENDFSLTRFPQSIRRKDLDTVQVFIEDISGNAPEDFLLYSSPDLTDWTISPQQNKSLQEGELVFDLQQATLPSKQFFNIFGVEP